MLLGRGSKTQAEAALKRAIKAARPQDARSWELRAATSLARLWQRQGKGREVARLLRGTYGWFAEGVDTANLRDAREVLNALA